MKKRCVPILLSVSISGGVLGMPVATEASLVPNQVIMMEKVSTQRNNCHDIYPNLVKAMMKLKAAGVLTDQDITSVHDYYAKNMDKIKKGDDKVLLEMLLKDKLVTEDVYKQLMKIMK